MILLLFNALAVLIEILPVPIVLTEGVKAILQYCRFPTSICSVCDSLMVSPPATTWVLFSFNINANDGLMTLVRARVKLVWAVELNVMIPLDG